MNERKRKRKIRKEGKGEEDDQTSADPILLTNPMSLPT